VFIRADFYDLRPDAPPQEFIDFERRVIRRYTEVQESRQAYYTGLYVPHHAAAKSLITGPDHRIFQFVGIYLLPGTPEERLLFPQPELPADFLALVQEGKAYDHPDPQHQLIIDFVPIAASVLHWNLVGRWWRIHLYKNDHPMPSSETIERKEVFHAGRYELLSTHFCCSLDLVRGASLQDVERQFDEGVPAQKESDMIWLEPIVSARETVTLGPRLSDEA
jgi:hypothetical protein